MVFCGGISPLTEELCYQLYSLQKGLREEGITNEEWVAALTYVQENRPNSLVGKIRASAERMMRALPHRPTQLSGIKPDVMAELKNDPLCLLRDEKTHLYEPEQVAYLEGLIEKHGWEVFATPPNLHLLTIHGSKGGEWDSVYVCQNAVPECADTTVFNVEEERRIKFVAATRTKKTLTTFALSGKPNFQYATNEN